MRIDSAGRRFAVLMSLSILTACEGPMGPVGPVGPMSGPARLANAAQSDLGDGRVPDQCGHTNESSIVEAALG